MSPCLCRERPATVCVHVCVCMYEGTGEVAFKIWKLSLQFVVLCVLTHSVLLWWRAVKGHSDTTRLKLCRSNKALPVWLNWGCSSAATVLLITDENYRDAAHGVLKNKSFWVKNNQTYPKSLSSGCMSNIQYYQPNHAVGQAWLSPHTYPNTQSPQFFQRTCTLPAAGWQVRHLCHCSSALLQWSDDCMNGDSPCVAQGILAKSCEGDGTIFSLLTSFTICKLSHEYDVLCIHLFPDVSKDFPFVQPDLFTRVNVFECMLSFLMYSNIKYAVLYVAQTHECMHRCMVFPHAVCTYYNNDMLYCNVLKQ